jgi:hypothetical protein
MMPTRRMNNDPRKSVTSLRPSAVMFERAAGPRVHFWQGIVTEEYEMHAIIRSRR